MTVRSTKRRTVEPKAPETEHSSPAPPVSPEARREMIAVAAYYYSQRRIAAGEVANEIRDWLEAEKAVEQAIGEFAPVHQHGQSHRD